MFLRFSSHLTIALLLLFGSGCEQDHQLKDFSSDGCSLFPDSSIITSTDWCDCCLEHDIAYWQGGTEAQRLEADTKLRDCVLAKTGDQTLADAMFQGVRFGGSPWFYNWYRWGYGWSYQRKYQKLTIEEQRLVTEKLVEFFKKAEGLPCE